MADDLRERIAKAIAGAVYGHNTLETAWADLHEDAQDEYFAEADAVIRELDSWDGFMSMLDYHYPATVFPTLPDDPGRDPGPRIVSLIRRINEIRREFDNA